MHTRVFVKEVITLDFPVDSYNLLWKTLWVRNIQDGRGLTEFMPMRLSVVYTLSSNTTDYVRYWFTTHNVVNQYSNDTFLPAIHKLSHVDLVSGQAMSRDVWLVHINKSCKGRRVQTSSANGRTSIGRVNTLICR